MLKLKEDVIYFEEISTLKNVRNVDNNSVCEMCLVLTYSYFKLHDNQRRHHHHINNTSTNTYVLPFVTARKFR